MAIAPRSPTAVAEEVHPPRPGGVGPRGSVRRAALAIFFGSLALYLANGRSMPSQDTIPARLLPISIWREADLDLDEFPFLYEHGRPYYLQLAHGHYVSSYPVGAALVALPFYFPVVIAGLDPEDSGAIAAEKLSAATAVALSAALVFLVLTRLVALRPAAWLAVVYALGTSSWSQSSQALWQHGPAQLAIAAGIYSALRAREAPGWMTVAGLSLAFAVVCRPADAVIAAPIAVWALLELPGRAAGLVGGGAIPLAFQLWYNTASFGDPLRLQWPLADGGAWSTPLAAGLAGLLLSPARGLLVYSPVFVFSIAGGVCAWRRGGDGLLRALSISAVAYLLLNARWSMWWGGYCYGPRLLADLSPVLILLIAPLAPLIEARRVPRRLFALAAAWSIALHATGAFCGAMGWNVRVDVDRHPERLWSWSDNQPAECLRALVGKRGSP